MKIRDALMTQIRVFKAPNGAAMEVALRVDGVVRVGWHVAGAPIEFESSAQIFASAALAAPFINSKWAEIIT